MDREQIVKIIDMIQSPELEMQALGNAVGLELLNFLNTYGISLEYAKNNLISLDTECGNFDFAINVSSCVGIITITGNSEINDHYSETFSIVEQSR